MTSISPNMESRKLESARTLMGSLVSGLGSLSHNFHQIAYEIGVTDSVARTALIDAMNSEVVSYLSPDSTSLQASHPLTTLMSLNMEGGELKLARTLICLLVPGLDSLSDNFLQIASQHGVTDRAARTALVNAMKSEFDMKLRVDLGHLDKFSWTPDASNGLRFYPDYLDFAYYKTRLERNDGLLERASKTTLFGKLGLTRDQLRAAKSNNCSRLAKSLTGISISLRGEYEKLWKEHNLEANQDASWWYTPAFNNDLKFRLRSLKASDFEGDSDRDITENVVLLSEIASATQNSGAPDSFKVLRQYLPKMTALIQTRLKQLPDEDRDSYAFQTCLVDEALQEILASGDQ